MGRDLCLARAECQPRIAFPADLGPETRPPHKLPKGGVS